MNDMKRTGILLVLWVANLLLRWDLTEQENEDLRNLRTHISVWSRNWKANDED